MTATHAHIVAIRRDGVVLGHQLRFDGGGPGKSRYFSAGKHGGPEQARRAAESVAQELGLPTNRARSSGHLLGRPLQGNRSGAGGIRFEWVAYLSGPILYVVATWQNRAGRPCSAKYSVDRNGLDGALDRALLARTRCGAPMPDRQALLDALRLFHATGSGG